MIDYTFIDELRRIANALEQIARELKKMNKKGPVDEVPNQALDG